MHNDINLIPDIILYKKNETLKKVKRVLLILVIGSVILAALAYKPYQWMNLKTQIADITVKVNNSGLDELDQAEARLTQRTRESADLVNAFNSLPKQKVKSTNLVKKIELMVPESISVETIKYTEKSNEIVFELVGKNRPDISLFLRRLRSDDMFTNVNMTQIEGKVNLLRFKVSIEYKT